MTGQTIILSSQRARETAKGMVDRAPPGAILNVREPVRSNDQNALMWTLLGYISRAKPEGRRYPPEVWKSLFMAACGHQVRWEPALDGNGVVAVGHRSSRLSKAQMSELIESIYAYGAENGVTFHELEKLDRAA